MAKPISFLTLLLTLTILTATASGENMEVSQQNALGILKNRLESVAHRQAAIDQLKSAADSNFIKLLIEIVRNSKESIILRGHVVETLIEINHPNIASGVKPIVDDASLDTDTRKLALDVLWRKQIEGIDLILNHLIYNHAEEPTLRAAAIKYLNRGEEAVPLETWLPLYSDSQNPIPVRVAALHVLEENGMLHKK